MCTSNELKVTTIFLFCFVFFVPFPVLFDISHGILYNYVICMSAVDGSVSVCEEIEHVSRVASLAEDYRSLLKVIILSL